MGQVKQMMIDQEESNQLDLSESTKVCEPTDNGLDALLKSRSVYGSFKYKATWIQSVKDSMRNTPSWKNLTCAEKEALDNIVQKTGRILYGSHHQDNFIDIAGYATLITQGD